jgi:1,4-alpha-glucan branching enzyme
MNVAVQGNFDVQSRNIVNPFPNIGWWYEYFTGDSLLVASTLTPLSFYPGEYRIYTNVKLPPPPTGYVTSAPEVVQNVFGLSLMPNPSPGGWGQAYFSIERGGEASIQVSDMLGRVVTTLHRGRLEAGEHQIELPQGLPAGAYLVRYKGREKINLHFRQRIR